MHRHIRELHTGHCNIQFPLASHTTMEAAAAIIARRTRARERKARSRANQTVAKRAAERIRARTGMARMRRKRAMLPGVGER